MTSCTVGHHKIVQIQSDHIAAHDMYLVCNWQSGAQEFFHKHGSLYVAILYLTPALFASAKKQHANLRYFSSGQELILVQPPCIPFVDVAVGDQHHKVRSVGAFQRIRRRHLLPFELRDGTVVVDGQCLGRFQPRYLGRCVVLGRRLVHVAGQSCVPRTPHLSSHPPGQALVSFHAGLRCVSFPSVACITFPPDAIEIVSIHPRCQPYPEEPHHPMDPTHRPSSFPMLDSWIVVRCRVATPKNRLVTIPIHRPC
mmetsp:Transcript_13/g.107  ORF Transcript_13/g.107 Transcript_13/m.107 type:complete len:254 (-) Transcript_13:188-949(-)